MTGKITSEEFTKRLVELCLKSGLRGVPRRARDRHILLKSITLTLDVKAEYTEEEVNERLKSWLRDVGSTIRRLDHVNLRRLLIDEEHLGRSKDGSRYWVGLSSRTHPTFESEVESLDVYDVIRIGREQAEQRKQDYLRRQAGR